MNYLYNGVELPALPEWDKETYPYAVIWYDDGTGTGVAPHYMLAVGKSPITYYNDFFGDYYFRNQTVGYAYSVINNPDNITDETNWGAVSELDTVLSSSLNVTLVWTNHDVAREDNSEVFLAASVPVPVLDPTALLQGYLVGCRIRAMRGKKKWEVLFEGEVTTTRDTPNVFPDDNERDAFAWAWGDILNVGDTIRLTVDGNAESSVVSDASQYYTNSDYYGYRQAGNAFISCLSFDNPPEDTGYDYNIQETWKKYFKFVSRNEGTYTVKIEKFVG